MKSVARARELNRLLNECNFPSTTIHSSMKQEERLKVCAGLGRSSYFFLSFCAVLVWLE